MNQRSKRLIAVVTAMVGIVMTAYGLLGFAIASTALRSVPAKAAIMSPMAFMVLAAAGIAFVIAGVIARRRFGGLAHTLAAPEEQTEAHAHERLAP
jgi:uncharacterized membrane protein